MTYLHILEQNGIKRVGWGGGEPLLRDDIYELGEAARSKGMGSLLRTSGMFEVSIDRARSAFDWIDFSFDSIDDATFRECRPGVNFKTLKANVINLANANFRVRVSILVTRQNLAHISETVAWLSSVGVRELRMQSLVKRGRAVTNWKTLKLEQSEESQAIRDAIYYARTFGMNAIELKTVSSSTLVILKPNGQLNIAHPDGQKEFGCILEDGVFDRLGTVLGEQQSRNYKNEQ